MADDLSSWLFGVWSTRKQAASDRFRRVMLEDENGETKPFGEHQTAPFAETIIAVGTLPLAKRR